jgi:hypothetical protein
MPAFFPPEGVGSFVDAQVRRFTPKTITDLKSSNREPGKAGVKGVPFAGLTSRVKCDFTSPMVTALKETAFDISAELFHRV